MSPNQRRSIPLPAVLLASVLATPAGADVRITGIIDGDLPGGAPKAIELYVSGTEDLGSYELWRSTNGGAFVFREALPTGSYTDEFVYLVGTAGNGRADFEAVFGTAGDFANVALVSGNINGNGNDGFRLVAGGDVIDQVWTQDATSVYTDSYMYRENGTGPDAGWVATNWDIPGTGVLDGLTAAQMGQAVPFATFMPDDDPVMGCGTPFTPIYEIQGSLASSPLVGQQVSTEGVVVADFEDDTSLKGFYMQDQVGDGSDMTSDGIFVYLGSGDQVSNGDIVRVTGSVQEWFGETQISSVQSLEICPPPTSTTSLPLAQIGQMPFPAAVAGVDYLERYEGMHVQFPQTLHVTEQYLLGRFGQLTLAIDDRLRQFTDLHEPDPAGYAAYLEEIELRSVVLDDPYQIQNPDPIIFPYPELTADPAETVRGGMTVTGMRGVMTYTWNGTWGDSTTYRLRPLSTVQADIPDFDETANPRPLDPPTVNGALKVVSYNVQNYFITLQNSGSACGGEACCGPNLDQQCRGAFDATELQRQTEKTVNAILAMDADIYGLTELENNGTGTGSAIRTLVDAVNAAAGEQRYAVAELPAGRVSPISGMGFVDVSDVISAGVIYKTSSVSTRPAPGGGSVVVLDDTAASLLPIADSLDFPVFDGFASNRASLAVSFEEIATGELFTVVVNHFKSKGPSDKDQDPVCQTTPAADPNCDQGDGQGFWNARRTDASRAVASWIEQDPTASGDQDFMIVGDLNSYRMEDPITELTVNQGYTDLADAFIADPYSFVFDGQWGYLDYALAKGPLAAAVTDVAEWHNNADEPTVLGYSTAFKSPRHVSLLYSPEPFRTSDHDPLIVGLDLGDEPPLPGDINGDGRVNFFDLRLLLDAIGTSVGDPGYLPAADLDGNGRINIRDLLIWIEIWRGS